MRIACMTLAAVCSIASPTIAVAEEDAGITWSVDDRYRLLGKGGADAGAGDAPIAAAPPESDATELLSNLRTCSASTGSERDGNPQVSEERYVACIYRAVVTFHGLANYPNQIPKTPAFKDTWWEGQSAIRGDAVVRKYDANYLAYSEPVFARLTVGAALQIANFTCTWSYGDAELRQSCADAARVRISRGAEEATARALVQVVVENAAGTIVASDNEDIVVDDIFVVSLGDSYASGEGNPDLPVDWRPLHDGLRERRSDSEERWWWQRRNLCAVAFDEHVCDGDEPRSAGRGYAQWWDPWCH